MMTKEKININKNHCKFKYGDEVTITYGFYEGRVGKINDIKRGKINNYLINVDWNTDVLVKEEHLNHINYGMIILFYIGILIMIISGIYSIFKFQFWIAGFDITLIAFSLFLKKKFRVLAEYE
jgi:hypothetical protein